MNIAFFLTPKQDVVYLNRDCTLRQTLERMEHHRFTAVPILNTQGEYVGTVTEGDLLWYMKRSEGSINFENAAKFSLADVPLKRLIQPVSIDANMEDLLEIIKAQNFAPVVDDMNRFIGIVRRSHIIEYCETLIKQRNF